MSLNKKVRLKFGAKDMVSFDAEWVSNGHWALRKVWVENAGLFVTEETIEAAFGCHNINIRKTEDLMRNILPPLGAPPLPKWAVTRLLLGRDQIYIRILKAEDGQIAGINNAYLHLVGITWPETLYSQSPDQPFCDEAQRGQINFVVMPFRLGDCIREIEETQASLGDRA